MIRRLPLALALAALAGCGTIRDALAPAPVGRPSGREARALHRVASRISRNGLK